MRCAAVMAWLVLTTTASAQDAPRYLPAIQEELERVGADEIGRAWCRGRV